LTVDGWAVTFDAGRRGLGGAAAPNVTAHSSTASVPITVLPYNDLWSAVLMCPYKGYVGPICKCGHGST